MAYSEKQKTEILDKICERIEKGEALRTVLKDKNMPSSRTFFKWIEKDEYKVKQYACACDDRAESIFEDIIIISDDQEGDTYEDENGMEQTNHNVIQRARLRVDSRKWILSKLNPKKYGDQSKLTIDATVKQESNYTEYSDEDLDIVTKIAEKYDSENK